MDLISVVIPVYNAERYLNECIDSVLSQTYNHIELLLIDDGSTDNSEIICSQYAEKYSVVKYIKLEHCGVSRVRNVGVQEAKGKHICFVDADDYIESDYLEKLSALATEHSADVVFCNHKLLYDISVAKRVSRLETGSYLVDDIKCRLVDDGTVTGILFGSVCMALYDLSIIKCNRVQFNEQITKNEDGIFNIELLKYVNSVYVTDYDGYLYRQWKSNKRLPALWDSELQKSTEYISATCSHIENLDFQLNRRQVSMLFWNALRIQNSDMSFLKKCKYLRRMLDEHLIVENYECLDYVNMGIQKKILINMLKSKSAVLFSFIISYIYPILKKVSKH